jgi:hypothetical protein
MNGHASSNVATGKRSGLGHLAPPFPPLYERMRFLTPDGQPGRLDCVTSSMQQTQASVLTEGPANQATIWDAAQPEHERLKGLLQAAPSEVLGQVAPHTQCRESSAKPSYGPHELIVYTTPPFTVIMLCTMC